MTMRDFIRDPLYSITYVLTQLIFPVLFRFKVAGRENVPPNGALIVAPTHRSYVDPIFVGAALPRRAFYMAKAEAFEVPLLGAIMRAYHAFPVRREIFDRRAIRFAMHLLAHGEALVMFPEGTRNPHHELLQPKLGIAYLALQTGAPVLPVALMGTEGVMPIGEARLRLAPVEVRFGEALQFELLKGEKPERELLVSVAVEIMRALSNLSGRPFKPTRMRGGEINA
ncbi:MAG: lysophospholipid acyltransferase family protein [Armatimonadota bacterium]|nr:1-acyl-sn-glycerol-3-phosphate acyltransferase [Armatimonadota bacterium]MCX7777314.1 1-acyl-sn-glycerol-3-phosphate acyltransferase [Armatimonadota bacterium]MDW8024369.1 lysophospholipid acyltransferase family protein [Armatimonadota bacterium]